MTTLVPQVQASALDGAADLESALKSITSRKLSSVPQKPATGSKVIAVKQETKDAISRLNGLLSSTKLPSERRALTLEEQVDIIELGSVAKLTVNSLDKVLAAVKAAVFNDLDIELETNGDVSGVPVNNGHYVVQQQKVVPGTDRKFVRQVAEHAPTVTAASLKALWKDGKISRATYYKLTQAVEVPREINEAALLAELQSNPELAEKI
jgi:hypothetical protein